jgi:hypothetical protein
MADEHGGHPLVKYKNRVLELLDELKKIVEEDGFNINDHLDDDCEVCVAVVAELKQKADTLKDYVDDLAEQEEKTRKAEQ